MRRRLITSNPINPFREGQVVKQTYPIREYGYFVAEKDVPDDANRPDSDGLSIPSSDVEKPNLDRVKLPSRTFCQLEKFITSNRSKSMDAAEMMKIDSRKDVGKIITAQNYVGVITLKDGTNFEILPKIVTGVKDDHHDMTERTKGLLVNMLRTLRVFSGKTLQSSHVDIKRMNIFEIFINMFINEMIQIVKRGLKCDYDTITENEKFLKGKLLFSQHIKHNYCHKERFFIQYDVYNLNRPEHRIMKTTLLKLYSLTSSSQNKRDLNRLLEEFRSVEPSADYKRDFVMFVPDRRLKDYERALSWCRIFLLGKSFTPFSGDEGASAVLFDMNALFERYVAYHLNKILPKDEFSLSVQDTSYHLFEEPEKTFLMKPDIVVRHRTGKAVYIMDTKWKILDKEKPNNGIKRDDMNQMFAYHL